MEHLKTFTEKDIFPDKQPSVNENQTFKDRITGKAIILNNSHEIVLIGNTINSFFILPGGGIEKNESIIDGIIRECREETGYTVEIGKEIGVVDDYRTRDNRHNINYCYTAHIIGDKDKPQLTDSESKNGLYTLVLPLDKVIQLFEEQKAQLLRGEVKFYNTAFNIMRDYIFIQKFLKL